MSTLTSSSQNQTQHLKNVEKTSSTSSTFTLPSPHNISVLEKTTKLLTSHPTTFIHQNKHYHVICIQNWHSLESINHHSCKVTYIRGLFKKYPTFLYKAHNTINFASFIQSPSKYSPWWFTHLSQRFCHFSKHFINSSPGML